MNSWFCQGLSGHPPGGQLVVLVVRVSRSLFAESTASRCPKWTAEMNALITIATTIIRSRSDSYEWDFGDDIAFLLSVW